MWRTHGRNLFRAVLRDLSARLRRRLGGSNAITSEPMRQMPSRQAASTFNSSWKACALEILGKGMWVSGLVEESLAAMLADRFC